MTYVEILERAAQAVLNCTDLEADFYESQDAVESWALRALELALHDNQEGAKAQELLDRYEGAPWNHQECEAEERSRDHDVDDPLHRCNWQDVDEWKAGDD